MNVSFLVLVPGTTYNHLDQLVYCTTVLKLYEYEYGYCTCIQYQYQDLELEDLTSRLHHNQARKENNKTA
jgi:hypothetical protein